LPEKRQILVEPSGKQLPVAKKLAGKAGCFKYQLCAFAIKK
jgi:hypothetical protein